MAASADHLQKMELRQKYQNLWHTNLMNTITADPFYCCFSCFCGPCVSYLLRKRALYNDMSRYVCCAGYMPCSGRCGESKCPELCLATETQHKVEMDKRDGKFGPQPMAVPPHQQMSRIDQPYPASVGYAPQQQAYGYPPQGYPPPQGQGYPQPQGQGYPPPQSQGYPPPQGLGYPPTGGYPPPAYNQGHYPPPSH